MIVKIDGPVEAVGDSVVDSSRCRILDTAGPGDRKYGDGEALSQAIADAINAGLDSGWRPIETAPRDGTWVLVLIRKGWSPTPQCVMRYHARNRSWVSPQDLWCKEPTHWMPLPAPPEPEPEPEPDPWALLRDLIGGLDKCSTKGVAKVREALAARDADQGGGA